MAAYEAARKDYRDAPRLSFTSSDDSTLASLVSSQTSEESIAVEEAVLEEPPFFDKPWISQVLRVSQELLDPSDYTTIPGVRDSPSCGPRGYHIPSAEFNRVLKSPPNSAASYWQYTLYQGAGGPAEKVKVHYCTTKESMETVLQHFLDENSIGFDVEWACYAKATDGIRRNVSLIQIASEEQIALFHLARFPGTEIAEDFVTPGLRTLMESPSIIKIGAKILGDRTRLRDHLGIECRGLLELSQLHKLVLYCSGELDKVDRRFVALSEQVQKHIGLPLFKGAVRTSDWSNDLRSDQIQYAASDAYANLHLFYALEAKRTAFHPTPPRPTHAEVSVERPCKRLKTKRGNSQSLTSPSGLPSLAIAAVSPNEPSSQPIPPHPYAKELDKAKEFIESYKVSRNLSISPRALRAYSLWHQQGLDIAIIAGILRTPPVLNRTVIGYLCDALSSLSLEFQCSPGKITGFTTVYGFRPYKRPHKELIAKAHRDSVRTN